MGDDQGMFPSLHPLQSVLELIGIYVFATSGALTAIRKDFDAVGILLLAEVTALGGGVIRDLLLGITPPSALTHVGYYLVPALAAAVAFVAHPAAARLWRMVLVFDAAGLGLFSVSGTLIGIHHGLAVLPAAGIGVITGVGGGVLRDIVARDIPLLVRAETDLYSVPAFAGALLVALLSRQGWAGPWAATGVAAFVFAFRLVALKFHWRAPRALRGRMQGPG
jgi:uncharacterized membrane protein YeiH